MIDAHIIPYLGNKKMNEITPSMLIQWQNEISNMGYQPTYLRMIQNQITALFNHACKIYDLAKNPCKSVPRMGKADAEEVRFWTKEEYDCFIKTMEKDSRYFVLFEILFWSGMRKGEALALTKSDIDFENNKINISKTFYRLHGEDIITSPKTKASVRTIDIPHFLKMEIQDYVSRLYEYPDGGRLFPIGEGALRQKMSRQIEKAGVKRIRVHDLRHSHVAYLIKLGIKPLVIKERLGHEDIRVTLNTYGHLYPNEQEEVAKILNKKR